MNPVSPRTESLLQGNISSERSLSNSSMRNATLPMNYQNHNRIPLRAAMKNTNRTKSRRSTINVKSSKRVSFGTTESRVFEVIKGHPDFDVKTPLSLGWTCVSTTKAVPVDQYEMNRAPGISDLEELVTSKKERKQMIKNCQRQLGKLEPSAQHSSSSVWGMLRRPTKVLMYKASRIQAC